MDKKEKKRRENLIGKKYLLKKIKNHPLKKKKIYDYYYKCHDTTKAIMRVTKPSWRPPGGSWHPRCPRRVRHKGRATLARPRVLAVAVPVLADGRNDKFYIDRYNTKFKSLHANAYQKPTLLAIPTLLLPIQPSIRFIA